MTALPKASSPDPEAADEASPPTAVLGTLDQINSAGSILMTDWQLVQLIKPNVVKLLLRKC